MHAPGFRLLLQRPFDLKPLPCLLAAHACMQVPQAAPCIPFTGSTALRTQHTGPAGASVREIMRRTGADIKSWTENRSSAKQRRPARIFLIGVRSLLNGASRTLACPSACLGTHPSVRCARNAACVV